MNPSDAMPKDFQMYYDNCWMRHSKLGVGRVRVVDGKLHLDCIKGRVKPVSVRPAYLTCWWPRPGAFNAGDNAVYVARRAMRNMRKSAVSNDHYFVKWGSPYNKDVMMTLRDGPNPMKMGAAAKAVHSGDMSSAAITRDIIITPDDLGVTDTLTVIFRGIEAGRLVHGNFEPAFSGSPLTGRILRQLEVVL